MQEFEASWEESSCVAMVGFSISSQPQASVSPRSLESPKTWIRDVPDCCAMGQHGHGSTLIYICRHLKQPELLSPYFVMEGENWLLYRRENPQGVCLRRRI